MNWILIKKENNQYLGWSKSTEKPACGEPDLLEWVEYRKDLPDDIDTETGEITIPVYRWDGKELVKDE